jgi:hypothetical protein
MNTITISLRDGRTMDGQRVHPGTDIIDLDTLSPRARALAETVHASLGSRASFVWIESDQPPYRTDAERAALGTLADEVKRQRWDAWDKYPADSPNDPHWYLERQAAKIPAGWHIIGPDLQTPVPTADRELTSDQVVATITRYQPAARMTARSWRSLVSKQRAPQPVRHVGRTPLWDPAEVLAWLQDRPGRGARTDLTAPNTPDTAEKASS